MYVFIYKMPARQTRLCNANAFRMQNILPLFSLRCAFFNVLKYGLAFWGQVEFAKCLLYSCNPFEEAARSLFSALPLPMAIIRIYLCCPSQWPPIKFDCQTFADISTWTASSNPIFVRFCVSAAGDFTLLVSVAFHVFALRLNCKLPRQLSLQVQL